MFGFLKKGLRREHERLAREVITMAREAQRYYSSGLRSREDPDAERKAELLREIGSMAVTALSSLSERDVLPTDEASRLLDIHRELLTTTASIDKAQRADAAAFRQSLGGKD